MWDEAQRDAVAEILGDYGLPNNKPEIDIWDEAAKGADRFTPATVDAALAQGYDHPDSVASVAMLHIPPGVTTNRGKWLLQGEEIPKPRDANELVVLSCAMGLDVTESAATIVQRSMAFSRASGRAIIVFEKGDELWFTPCKLVRKALAISADKRDNVATRLEGFTVGGTV